jgi:hypothetical protein
MLSASYNLPVTKFVKIVTEDYNPFEMEVKGRMRAKSFSVIL